MTTTPAMEAIAAAAQQHLADTATADRQLIGDDAGPHWGTVEQAANRLAFIDTDESAAVRLLDEQNDARGREIERLRAELGQARSEVERIRTRENEVRTARRQGLRELEQARQQTEDAHCRLHYIAARLEHLDVRDDPTGVAGDVGPFLDGPLHPDHLAAYRAAQSTT